jgi:arylsulfatase A-like enzyme
LAEPRRIGTNSYWEFHERGFRQAARMGDWKAVRPKWEGPVELYNLHQDPSEKANLAATHPDVAAKLDGYLKSARTDSERWPIKTPPANAVGGSSLPPDAKESQ